VTETQRSDTATPTLARSLFKRVSTIGHDRADDRGVRTRKTTLALTTAIAATAVIPWGLFYVSIGLVRAGAIPLTYSAVSFAGLAHLHRTHDDRFLRHQQIVLFVALPALVHIALGGFVNSSGVIMYSIIGVLGALSFADTRRPTWWLAGYAMLVFVLVPLNPTFRRWAPDLSTDSIVTLFAVNIVTTSLLVYVSMLVYVRARNQLAAELTDERARSERLLLNVLPASIAERLKEGERPIADRYDSVAVLFADIVDFTPLSESLSADDLVEGLNGVFSEFDKLAAAHNVEKVKTIGDAYMVISGAPDPGADVDALATLALEMRSAAAKKRIGDRVGITMRFGIDVGPAVAGVIGESRFMYDVYGDTVNMASRMESSGLPNKIQLTKRLADRLDDRFVITERGPIDIKGKGTVTTYFLDGLQ
jgi:guanylate cyclase